MAACTFARRLKTLGGTSPYDYIGKIWTSKPDTLSIDPIHQMEGLTMKAGMRQHMSDTTAESLYW